MLGFALLRAAVLLRCRYFTQNHRARNQGSVQRPHANPAMSPRFVRMTKDCPNIVNSVGPSDENKTKDFASATCTSLSAGEPILGEHFPQGHPNSTPQALIRISTHTETIAAPGKPFCPVSYRKRYPKNSVHWQPEEHTNEGQSELWPSSSSLGATRRSEGINFERGLGSADPTNLKIYVGYPASSRRRTGIPSALRASRSLYQREDRLVCFFRYRARLPRARPGKAYPVACPRARAAGVNAKVCETG